jgi:hypothetical protein
MMMLVNLSSPRQKKRFSSDLFFLILTLIPWILMFGLLLPHG